jgi:hypothetical protein
MPMSGRTDNRDQHGSGRLSYTTNSGHAGNHYTANAGANLRELMEPMGHSTNRAAMIYLHSTDPRQRTLADAVGKAARAELRQGRRWPPKIKKAAHGNGSSGTEVARDRQHDS